MTWKRGNSLDRVRMMDDMCRLVGMEKGNEFGWSKDDG